MTEVLRDTPRDALPDTLRRWCNPDVPLAEPSRYFPGGFARPWWAPPCALLAVFWNLAIIRQYLLEAGNVAMFAATFALLGLPLLIFAVLGLRRWWPATRARGRHRKGRWRDGVFLLDEGLLVVSGASATFVPRQRVRALRSHADAQALNRKEKREGQHRVRPGIFFEDSDGAHAFVRIDEPREIWWSLLAARWSTWKQDGSAPDALPAPVTAGAALRDWLPNLAYLQGLYLLVTVLGLGLFHLLASLLGADAGFMLSFVLGLALMFGFIGLAFVLLKGLKRRWPELPVSLAYEHGGGYAVLLGFCAFGSLVVIGGQSALWWQTAFAARLTDVRVADAPAYRGQNVLLGLSDAVIEARRYGAYQPLIHSADHRRSERGNYLYVTRLTSTDASAPCLYLGAAGSKVHRRSEAQRLLVPATFYREPLRLASPADADDWARAVDDLEGDGPRCTLMIVEGIDNPDALAAEEWRGIWRYLLLFQVLPLVMLLAWAFFKREQRWL